MQVSVTPSAQFRDSLGRFARFSLASPAQQRLTVLGQTSVSLLANATPVRTGAMRAGWRQTYVPSQTAVHISNQMPYAGYVVWGTRRMPANPNLQRVITQELPRQAQVTAQAMAADISVSLKG